MIERLTDSIFQRTSLGRGLLKCLVGIALPAAIGWGLIFQLMERRDAARTTVTVAYAERDWLSQMQEERFALLTQMNELPDADTEIRGLSELEKSLVQVGIREFVTSFSTPTNDQVTIRLTEVAFSAIMAWLQIIDQSAGYRLVHLRLTELGHQGKVAAEVDLRSLSSDID